MNNSVEFQLKRLVALAVHPVAVTRGQKRKMREELLAHLTATYEQERARLGDEARALAATRERFGDPGALAAELQRAAPSNEKALLWLEGRSWNPGVSPMYCAAMAALTMTASFALAALVAVPVKLLLGKADDLIPTLRALLVVATFGSVLTPGFILLADRVGSSLFGYGELAERCMLPGALWLLFSLVSLPLWAFAMMWVGTGELSAALRHFWFACWLAPIAPALLLTVGRELAKETRYEREWSRLLVED